MGYIANAYAGTFDGDFHTISGLKIQDSGTDGVGLFGTVNGATIQNLKVIGNVSASGSAFVGGIIGKTGGTVTIKNCSFAGSVKSDKSGITSAAAGVVGRVNAGRVVITGCSNSADITGGCAAGILGYCTSANNAVENCYNTGLVSGANRTGGIAGQVSVSTFITNCYTKTDGICGFNGKIDNCYDEADPPADAAVLGSAFTTDESGNIILSRQSFPGKALWSGRAGPPASGCR